MQPQPGYEKLNLEHKIRFCGDKSAPLVFLVHGRAGNYDVMWTFSRILGGQCNIIAPQAPLKEKVIENNADGYSWWLLNEAGSLMEWVKKAEVELLEFIEAASRAYNLTPTRSFALGFSQGAALLSFLIQEKPQIFTAVALLAGFVIEAKASAESILPNVFIAHGTKDEIININLSEKGRDFLLSRGFPVSYHTEDVGHKVGVQTMKELTAWFNRVNV